MFDVLQNYYDWLKAFHIIFMVLWVSGMFYLTRLFVVHSDSEHTPKLTKLISDAERKILRGIINPSMVITILLGLCLAQIYGWQALGRAFHIKMAGVLFMIFYHTQLVLYRKKFEVGKNSKTPKFFRASSITLLGIFVVMVIMAAVKPFGD